MKNRLLLHGDNCRYGSVVLDDGSTSGALGSVVVVSNDSSRLLDLLKDTSFFSGDLLSSL